MSTKSGQGFAVWTESRSGNFARVSVDHLLFIYATHFIHGQLTGACADRYAPALCAVGDLGEVTCWTKNL